jgi:hypothetical protein
MSMKYTFHVPTQQYGFLEIEGEDLKEMEQIYNKYAEFPIDFSKKGNFVKYITFTGEEVLYDKDKHLYTDLEGNALLSASKYAQRFEKPFPKEIMLPKVAQKFGVDEKIIDSMWGNNGNISRTFGNALHYTLDQYFKYKDHGTEYHLPKHPFLKRMLDTLPEFKSMITEPMVSLVKEKLVGQIDAMEVLDSEKKVCNIVDWKSDVSVEKNLVKHQRQMSFYAYILIQHGWTVEKLKVCNYVEDWKVFESEVLPVKL